MKKFFITLMCVVMVVCFMPTVAMAEGESGNTESSTYYVANNGSDSNLGTEEAPFANIQKAVNKAIDGDTIIVKEGSYNVWCPTSDSNNYTGRDHNLFIGKNITIKGEGEVNIYSLQETYQYSFDRLVVVLISGSNGVVLENLNIYPVYYSTLKEGLPIRTDSKINEISKCQQLSMYYNQIIDTMKNYDNGKPTSENTISNVTIRGCAVGDPDLDPALYGSAIYFPGYVGTATNQAGISGGYTIENNTFYGHVCICEGASENATSYQCQIKDNIFYGGIIFNGKRNTGWNNVSLTVFPEVTGNTFMTNCWTITNKDGVSYQTIIGSRDADSAYILTQEQLNEMAQNNSLGGSLEGKMIGTAIGVNSASAGDEYHALVYIADPVAQIGDNKYDSLQAAINAAADGQTVKLLSKLKINSRIDISTGKNIVLDLGGYKLSSDLATAINLTHGCLNVENGTIEAEGEAFRINGKENEASLKIASNVEVVSNKDCCVFMYGGGAKLFTSGNLTSKGVYATIQGNGLASSAGTLIDISGGNIIHTNSVAIYHPQNGTMNITGGVIEGSTGIYFKSGSLNITGGTIKGNGNKAEFVHDGSGCNSTGDGLVIEACDYPGGHPTVNISGGTFTSTNADAIGYYEYEGNSMSNKKFISGGTFTPAVNNDYLAPGVVQDSKGNVYKPYYGGSIPTDSLKAARTEAIKAVSDYVDPADYEEAQQVEIKRIVDNAKKDIEAAKTADEIKAIEAAAKAELDKLKTAEEMALIRAIEETKFVARSKAVTLKNGKKAIKITWYDKNGKEVKFDGVEIFRSTKRYSGYGKEPIYVSKSGVYYNTAITPGTKYYYKVRGYVTIDGEKVYTDYSTKAWRTVK